MKLRDRILADPRVESLEDERNGAFTDFGADWWCYLKKGFVVSDDYTHSIHEPTLTEVYRKLRHDVEPCRRACCGGDEGPAL